MESETPPVCPAEPNPEEFAEMIDRYYLPLRRFAGSLVRCGARAEDLAHQTVLIFAQHGHQIRDRAKVRQWLFTTLWREHLREIRRTARAVGLPDMDVLLMECDAPAEVSIGDPHAVRAALAALPPPAAGILRLRYFQGLSYRALAEALGVPIGTVMSRLSRAHRALRKRLESGVPRRQGAVAGLPGGRA